MADDSNYQAWLELVKHTLGPEADTLFREGKLSEEEMAQKLETRGLRRSEIEKRMSGLAEKFLHEQFLPAAAVPRPPHIPPAAHPKVFRAPYTHNMNYILASNIGFACDGHRLPPFDAAGHDELMELNTGRVAHNVVCSHTDSASLTFRRCSMVGVQVTIAHPRPMSFWVNATRRSTTHMMQGSVPFWGSSSASLDTFIVLEVYAPGESAGGAGFSQWTGPQSSFAASNAGSRRSMSFGATSVQINGATGPIFPVGTQVLLMAGIGTRHLASTTFADLTTSTVNDWIIDSISMWP